MNFEGLAEEIKRLLAQKNRVLLAIDGNCGSGKSTLALALARQFCCNVFHADDFYLPPEMRTPQRLAEVGGNMDRERLQAQVLEPLQQGLPFSYRPLLCPRLVLGEPVFVEPRPLNIIEGSYSMHPQLRGYYDLSVFLSVSPARQAQRILERNGPEKLAEFQEKWIPRENAYFEGMRVKEACTLYFET